MKKAKEYAKEILDKYIETDADTALKTAAVSVISSLCRDYEEIKKQRNLVRTDGISYNGILNVLKELHVKWLSICRIVNKEVNILSETGWIKFVQDQMPGLYPNFIELLQRDYQYK